MEKKALDVAVDKFSRSLDYVSYNSSLSQEEIEDFRRRANELLEKKGVHSEQREAMLETLHDKMSSAVNARRPNKGAYNIQDWSE